MNIFKHTSVNSKVDKYKFTISYRWFFFHDISTNLIILEYATFNRLTDPRSRPANAGLCCKYGWETEDFYKDAPNVKSYKLLIFLGTNLRISTIFFLYVILGAYLFLSLRFPTYFVYIIYIKWYGVIYFYSLLRSFWENVIKDDNFLEHLVQTLKESRFTTYFFETPSVTKAQLDEKVGTFDWR